MSDMATSRRLIIKIAFTAGVLPLIVALLAEAERSGEYELPKYDPDCGR
jgi:hypothetical protein